LQKEKGACEKKLVEQQNCVAKLSQQLQTSHQRQQQLTSDKNYYCQQVEGLRQEIDLLKKEREEHLLRYKFDFDCRIAAYLAK